jgi:hypothetical protein
VQTTFLEAFLILFSNQIDMFPKQFATVGIKIYLFAALSRVIAFSFKLISRASMREKKILFGIYLFGKGFISTGWITTFCLLVFHSFHFIHTFVV